MYLEIGGETFVQWTVFLGALCLRDVSPISFLPKWPTKNHKGYSSGPERRIDLKISVFPLSSGLCKKFIDMDLEGTLEGLYLAMVP